VDTFHPRVAVLLNVTADHLDRYPDMDAYAAAKARIFGAQTAEDFAVVNVEDPLAMRASQGVTSRRLCFSSVRALPEGGCTDDSAVVAALDGFARPVVLIAGGRDKGGDYAPLAATLERVGRAAVLIGEAADKMDASLRDALPVVRAPSMEEAVEAARRLAQPG